jgi:spore maturation protein CgeB
MGDALRRFATDDDARQRQAERGLETILARHTCDHRAAQLLDIVGELASAGGAGNRESGLGNRGQRQDRISTEAACT